MIGTTIGRIDSSRPNLANLPRSWGGPKVTRAQEKKLRRLRRNARHPGAFTFVPGELPLIEWIGLLDK